MTKIFYTVQTYTDSNLGYRQILHIIRQRFHGYDSVFKSEVYVRNLQHESKRNMVNPFHTLIAKPVDCLDRFKKKQNKTLISSYYHQIRELFYSSISIHKEFFSPSLEFSTSQLSLIKLLQVLMKSCSFFLLY